MDGTAHPAPLATAIGIVVPLFKHSVLVADALASLMAQSIDCGFVVVVVDDGCPFTESGRHVDAIRACFPARIRYVLQPNGGLSAARNTGIDIILRDFATVEAIYFMDADNMLRPCGLQAGLSRLRHTPDASWVYPNIDMFGIEKNFDYSGPYNPLKHAFYNICEAGSLVHRRVFEAGIRFDPVMRSGFEDWEFWLQAIDAGFSGVHEPQFGFLYRNRAESMLSQSKRDEHAIIAYVRAKHPRLWRRDVLHRMEDAAAPLQAIILLDTDRVMLGVGGGRTITHMDCETLVWRNIIAPDLAHVPHLLFFTTQATYDELATSGLLAWAMSDCRASLATHDFASLELVPDGERTFSLGTSGQARGAHLIAFSRDILAAVLLDTDSAWIEQLASASPALKLASRTLALPRAAAAPPNAACIFGLLYLIMRWRASPFRAAAGQPWGWRARSVPPADRLHHDVAHRLGGVASYPRAADSRPAIGFTLPLGGLGGVERVACNIAAVFASAGWSTHLFMIGTSRLTLPEEFAATFTSINFLEDPELGGWDEQRQYQGTALSACAANPAAVARMAGALGWLDVVVNHHSGAVNEAAALLRRGGTRMVTHLHLLDNSPAGRPTGHAVLALAYEHAYDLIVCGSGALLHWMRGAGVPDDKLMMVRNAPGYGLAAATQRECLAARALRSASGLRAIFIGRLDRQKGIDRLAELIELTGALGMDVTWRVVGAAVVDTARVPPVVAAIAEPPVTRGAELTALFAWADVMVLLSDFEGVPLSILEAQRLGVCVIATDVGGVGEVIDSGRNGFLVPLDSAVADSAALLQLLLDCPPARRKVAAACAVPAWGEACLPLLAWASEEVKQAVLF